MIYNNITEIIGNTPSIKINNIFRKDINVFIKLEKQNPGGSIKDRIALAMIEDAENKSILKQNSVIIEPTSGNTGIGLAMVAAVKGYRLILTMPESMSVERRKILQAYGAEIVLTEAALGMKGAIDKANELNNKIENSWIPRQFDNPANPEIHRNTTAIEVINDFKLLGLDYYITGIGTGGHITGVSEVLKSEFPNIKCYGVEPADSPVLSGGNPGPHAIQGIGAGFVPSVLDQTVIDNIIQVEKNEAFDMVRKMATQEALFVGISTGASVAALYKIQDKLEPNSNILLMNYDTGERYLSVDSLF
ncbi:MAG: cysteine synthase A [Marinifilaceae bacterium]|jgi:cysteine synthase A|nr:cysteine synthase A [Marinifilaceae bacterium]